mmetsp:Transcript_17944/g.51695  ORF Transcript_17944/g.51695 Transcript_17944/m.51695 type:complete len:325 (+) Transcript_17944:1197-2171(+)
MAVAKSGGHRVHAPHALLVPAHLQRHVEGDALDEVMRDSELLAKPAIIVEPALKHSIVAEECDLRVVPFPRVLPPLGLDEHRHQGAVPVAWDNNDTIAVGEAAERQVPNGNGRGLAEVGEAHLVVVVVHTPLRAVQLRPGWPGDAMQEPEVVHEDIVHLLLVGVEKVNGLPPAIEVHRGAEVGVPCLNILVVAWGHDHHPVPQSGQRHGQSLHCVTEAAGLRKRRHLAGDEGDLESLADRRARRALRGDHVGDPRGRRLPRSAGGVALPGRLTLELRLGRERGHGRGRQPREGSAGGGILLGAGLASGGWRRLQDRPLRQASPT